MQNSDHVGLLVAGVFNASISGASLVDNHVFDSTGDCWVDGDEQYGARR